MLELSAALLALILAGLIAALWKQRCATRRIGALLDTVPLLRFCWTARGEQVGGRAGAASYQHFLGGLTSAAAAQLEAARAELVSAGTSFSARFAARRGTVYAIEGRRAATGDTALWVSDASAATTAERLSREVAGLREMLDALPVPVWRRGPGRALEDCNRAYARALDTTRELVISEGRELAHATKPDGRCHIVVRGLRRLMEIAELPCSADGNIGFALDRTDLETAEAELRRHVNAHAEVLEGIRASVAIYGPDKRLKFFNSAFASMWGIADDWLASQPSFEEVLERLRELRRLPEAADFLAFKCEQLGMFTSVIKPQQELMHLPDGRTLLLSISPHPFGGLTFVYEDVTDRLALERSCNTLTQVRRATLDHLFEGIAVFGSDGRLKLCNPAYLALWELSEEEVAGEPHIGAIVEKTRPLLDNGGDWTQRKERIVTKVTAHVPASGPVYRTDGSMLQEAAVPLPDGNMLLTYLDVTDTARVERALRERNEALETAARLKSEFIANVSHELRTPLNAVISFAEILNNQYFGDLNARQLEYSRGILASAHQLLKLINDILDLATIEAGYMMLETGQVDVFETLKTVLSLTRERACSRNLALDLQCPADIGMIEADETRLKQALFNLVSSAIRFTLPGGVITLRAERGKTELSLTVADTGIGSPQSDQGGILRQLERVARRSDTGLGLSLVKRLIELHGGSVAIESAIEPGTRIICRLPIAQRAAADTDFRPPGTASEAKHEAEDGSTATARALQNPSRTREAA
ncbi:MAG: PAS-domain containing protein [Stellaceae bacterium]